MIVGVDNGSASGALVAIDESGNLIDYAPLPAVIRGGRSELDVVTTAKWIEWLGDPTGIAVEEPLHRAPSTQSMRSMAMCYGMLKGMCNTMHWPFADIQVRDWQKSMLGKFPKGQSKKFALAAAQELEPDEKWHDPTKPRARTPHIGIVDAYLVAQYALQERIF
tara:strand:+ start:4712 stop:5203 length:492 start_codon:yes stop_codon:yes gene_type:complete